MVSMVKFLTMRMVVVLITSAGGSVPSAQREVWQEPPSEVPGMPAVVVAVKGAPRMDCRFLEVASEWASLLG